MFEKKKNHRAKKKLGDVAQGRDNNLNLLRLLAAALVIASHSFALLNGSNGFSGEPLATLTDGMLSLGGMAVGVFFLFGGFLISKSCTSCKSTGLFYKKRALRIFPELFITIFLTTFLVGPIVTSQPVEAYFASKTTYLYLLNALLIPIHPLPGVFVNNPYPNVVNGSLWTLPVEFLCYILVHVCWRITHFEKKRYALLCIPCVFISTLYFIFMFPELSSVVRAVFLFWIGTTAYVYRDIIPYNKLGYALCIPIFLLLLLCGAPTLAMLIPFPPALFLLAYEFKQPLGTIRTLLDKFELSYGIYLWGWPIGQLLVQMCPQIEIGKLIMLTLFTAGIVGGCTSKLSSSMLRRMAKK